MKSKILHLLLLPLILALVVDDCEAQSDRNLPGRFYEGRLPAGHATCPGTGQPIRGSSFVLVRYADSSINVTAYTPVGKDRGGDEGVGAIEFKLIPTGGPDDPSFNAATVKIIGTEGPDSNGKKADASWLNGTGQGRDSIVVCPHAGTPKGLYKYAVEVENVGTLDPRAEVIE